MCRTNTAPSTAFRAFGDVQGKNIVENAIDDAAFALGMTAEEVRRRTFIALAMLLRSGRRWTSATFSQVWDYLKNACELRRNRASVEEFNRQNNGANAGSP